MKRVVGLENGAEPREHEFSSVGSGRAGWCRMTGRKEGVCKNRVRNKPLGGHRVGPVGEGQDSVEVHRAER